MKITSQLFIAAFAFLAFATSAHAQSPREQLNQMVQQLQKTPNDIALREKIIKLAPTLKPAPALPDTAVAFEGRAQFAFKNAKSEGDYLAAAQEYEKAVAIAPWVPGYYADLCTIYEKAGKFEDAKRHCGFYLSALTDPAQMTDVKRRIAGLEFGIEKAATANAAAAAKKARRIADGTLIVPGKGAGPVRLGMSEAEAIAVMGSTTRRETGTPGSVWLVWGDGIDSVLRAGFYEGRVVSVSTNKSRYTTSDNLSVGSSMSDVKAAMGQEDSVRSGPGWQRLCYAQGILFYFEKPEKPPIVTSIEVREINWCVK